MKNLLIIILVLASSLANAQKLNAYKYVLVPEKFEAFDKPNEYRLNELTKAMLEKEGFEVYTSKLNLPEDGLKNNCLVLETNLLNDSGFFTTKVALEFLNCKNEVVFVTPFGDSREKSYLVAYNKALRNAGKCLEGLNYKYNSEKQILPIEINSIAEKESLKSEIEKLKQEKEKIVANRVEVEEKFIEKKFAIKASNKRIEGEYYAEERQKEGWKDYNIYDSKGVLYFIFYNTGKKDTFLVQQANNTDHKICFKANDLWYLVTRDETKMETKILKINF